MDEFLLKLYNNVGCTTVQGSKPITATDLEALNNILEQKKRLDDIEREFYIKFIRDIPTINPFGIISTMA